VTSDEPSDTPDPQQNPTGAGGASTPSRRGPRPALVVLVAVLGMVAVAGVAGLVVYDRATAIDRSTPTVVADQFLGAAIVERDPRRVGLFICSEWTADEAIRELTTDIGDDIVASWGDLAVEQNADSAVVTAMVKLTFQGQGSSQRNIESWQIALRNSDGWRVCDVTRNQSLDP
jgi:hypothetical protein